MRTAFFYLLFFSSSCTTFCQDLKLLDYADVFRKNKVHTQTVKEISYKNKVAVDTLVSGIAEFDAWGRMISYKEFFAGGRHYATYRYQYDESGKVYSASIEHVFAEFKPVYFNLTYDTKGRVIERMLREPIRNFWMKETFTYNYAGVLVKSEQWYDRGDKLEVRSSKTHPETNGRDPKSLSNLFDQRGLPILCKKQSANNGTEISEVYEYSMF